MRRSAVVCKRRDISCYYDDEMSVSDSEVDTIVPRKRSFQKKMNFEFT